MKELKQLKKLIQQIRDSGEKYDFILTIARGGLVPAQFIAYALDIEVIHVINNVRGSYPRSQASQRCLIVDDINDTSGTLTSMTLAMINSGNAKRCDWAVIYERYSSHTQANYVGEIINHDDHIEFTWDKEIV